MNYQLSASKLNLLNDCPKCFWLAVKKNIRRPSIAMPSIIYKIDSITKSYFDKYRTTGLLPPIISGQINGRLMEDMPKTLNFERKNGVSVCGRPDDFLQIKDGAIVPFDHKTKSKPPQCIHPAYQLQMDVYSLLLRMNNYQTDDRAYLAFYYPDDYNLLLHNGLPISCMVVEVKTNPSHAEELVKKACDILDGPMPESRSQCSYCNWFQAINNNQTI